MTIHDQQADVSHSTDGVEPPKQSVDPAAEQTDPGPDVIDAMTADSDPTTPVEEPHAEPAPAAPSSDAGATSLFADDELAELRARWDSVQAAFVDDPAQCVQKADGLVSDVVEQLTTGFSQARSRLEEQWARGEEASTEDLRVALKAYREFFQRLLAV